MQYALHGTVSKKQTQNEKVTKLLEEDNTSKQLKLPQGSDYPTQLQTDSELEIYKKPVTAQCKACTEWE